MEEASIDRDQPLIADDQAAEMAKRCERALDDPPAAIPPQFPAVLRRRPLAVTPCRANRVDAPPSQARPQRVALIAAIRDQALRSLARASRRPRPPDGDRVKGLLDARDLRRGRRLQVCSQRRSPRHRPAPSTLCPGRVWSCRPWLP